MSTYKIEGVARLLDHVYGCNLPGDIFGIPEPAGRLAFYTDELNSQCPTHVSETVDTALGVLFSNQERTEPVSQRTAEAIKEYFTVLDYNPDHVDTRINLAVAYFTQQAYNEAIKHYKEAIRLSPKSFQAYYGLGYSYFMLGSYPEAMQYLKEAIRIKPDYLEAQLLLNKVTEMAILGITP